MLTQLTTSEMPERFGLTPAESETLRVRVIALMNDSRSKMGAEDIPIRTAKGKQIQQRASALGQPKRPSDGPDRRDAARQRERTVCLDIEDTRRTDVDKRARAWYKRV